MKIDISYPKGKRIRSKIVIHSQDLWSGDVTLAKVIHPMLVKYRAYYDGPNPMKGIPMSMFDKIQEVTDDETVLKEYELSEFEALERWISVLDTMIYAFYWIKTDSTFGPLGKQVRAELDLSRKEIKKLQRQEMKDCEEKGHAVDRCLDVYKPVFDKYKKDIEAHNDKIKLGLRLFGEHFQSLWI